MRPVSATRANRAGRGRGSLVPPRRRGQGEGAPIRRTCPPPRSLAGAGSPSPLTGPGPADGKASTSPSPSS